MNTSPLSTCTPARPLDLLQTQDAHQPNFATFFSNFDHVSLAPSYSLSSSVY